ncbi:hypothetical protein R1flu_009460 [Riccia fluitans]|uniref:CBF1-interacting co-repressor CIR N-terminal domain-containing protein n=1 Tax=Riccia fluitans TaxID=41844 RepID=A0ABD1Z2B6_9MARC
MGGHGGLNILPQKRWNVYNFENREKVKRDEEEAAREEAIRQQKARREETEFKLEKLREAAKLKRRRVENGSSPVQEAGDGALVVRGILQVEESKATIDLERPSHINLFAEYEAREKEGHGRVQEREKERKSGGKEKDRRKEFQDHRDRQLEKKDGKLTGEPADDHYRLGYGASSKSGKKPWYMVKSFMVDRTQREEEETSDSIVRIADGAEQKTLKSSKSKKSVEDLRAERLAREQQERDKARKVLLAKAGSSYTDGYSRRSDGRVPHYHASFVLLIDENQNVPERG